MLFFEIRIRERRIDSSGFSHSSEMYQCYVLIHISKALDRIKKALESILRHRISFQGIESHVEGIESHITLWAVNTNTLRQLHFTQILLLQDRFLKLYLHIEASPFFIRPTRMHNRAKHLLVPNMLSQKLFSGHIGHEKPGGSPKKESNKASRGS